MAEHTPGPWIVFVGPDGFDVLPAMRRGRIAGPIDNATDADLIASAPDMLAALREVVRGLDAEWNERITDVNFPLLRAAIAKAEGRS